MGEIHIHHFFIWQPCPFIWSEFILIKLWVWSLLYMKIHVSWKLKMKACQVVYKYKGPTICNLFSRERKKKRGKQNLDTTNQHLFQILSECVIENCKVILIICCIFQINLFFNVKFWNINLKNKHTQSPLLKKS